jgi:hypothetical protein
MGFFGGDKESHKGGTTERFSGGTSVTRDDKGRTIEYTRHETLFPLGAGEKLTVTRNGDGKVINVQEGWGKKA